MGQKINPIAVRLNVNRRQNSLWFSKNNYAKNLHKQFLLKEYLSKVFQVSNLSLGPCYIQMLPKKLKVYPFFNSSNKSVFVNKKSYLFKRYLQSKYSKNRNLKQKSGLSGSSLMSLKKKSWKKDLSLWQNSRPFIRIFDKLIGLKKNKKDGSKGIFKNDCFLENEKKVANWEESEGEHKETFNVMKNEDFFYIIYPYSAKNM